MDTVLFDSPVGKLALSATHEGVCRIQFEDDETDFVERGDLAKNPHLQLLCRELDRYFNGAPTRFTCRIALTGTPFQKKVWNRLATIPFGETRSYGDIAEQIGQPTASRAVGMANNRNPVPIIVPCHRVNGKSGKLVGFGGGLWRKEWLLQHEGITLPLGSNR